MNYILELRVKLKVYKVVRIKYKREIYKLNKAKDIIIINYPQHAELL